MHNTYVYLFIMAGVTYAIRVLPLTLIRGKIQSPFIQSFLYYVPYVTLAVMTFPAILSATQNTISAIAAFLTGILTAWLGFNLFKVAVSCCAVVFLVELFCL